MVQSIIKFALNNRLLVLALTLVVCIAAIYTLKDMETDVFPDLTAPTVVIMTEADGMAPEEVERFVTFPIETAVNGSTGIRRVRSQSAQGYSIVWVEFDWDMEVYKARQVVTERLQSVQENLPEGTGSPTLMPQSSIMGEIYVVALTADSTSNMELRTLSEWVLRPRILAVNGVANVTVFSRESKQYQVTVDPNKLAYYSVTLEELEAAVGEGNTNAPGGYIDQSGSRYTVRGIGRTADVNKLSDKVIKLVNEEPILVKDVARVEITTPPAIGGGSYNGKEGAIIMISKQPDVNTIDVTALIDECLVDAQNSLPADVKIHTDIFKQSDFIESSLDNVISALYEGAILVTIILLLFLMNVKVTIISLVSIPVSLFIAIICLKLMGMGINTMVLGGMSIAIGSLVDDAIVDVENVYKRLRQNVLLPESERQTKWDVIYTASLEIRSSIVNATFIIIAAFLPLFFLSGMEGRMLRPLGLTYVISLFGSLIVAMTLTNVMEYYMLGNEKELLKQANGSWLERKLTAGYELVLRNAIKYRKLVVGTTVSLFIGAVVLFSSFGRSFLPDFNEGTLTLFISTMPNVSYDEGSNAGIEAEKILMTIPEVLAVERRTGRTEMAEHASGINASEIDVPYEMLDRPHEEFIAEVRSKLNSIPGVLVEVGQPLSHRINAMLSGSKASIAIKIFGEDLALLYKIGKEIESKTKGVEGLVDLVVEQQIAVPQVKITPKEHVMSSYGVTTGEFADFISTGLNGKTIGNIFENERSFPFVIRFEEADRNDISKLSELPFQTDKGVVPFGYLADIKSSTGANSIGRENVKRLIVVSANVSERDARGVVNDIKKIISDEVTLPAGYFVQYGGQFESEESASRTILLTSILSILIIFTLLYQEFKNVTTSLIVLLNLPMALIGGVVAINMSFGELNIPAIIGFITLFGIATRNGILLVTRYIALFERGMDFKEAIIKGSCDRLMPILMTALTAALALIPMAMASQKAGNEIQSPMAIVIIGGLLSSTLLNVFILPIVFWVKESRKAKKNNTI